MSLLTRSLLKLSPFVTRLPDVCRSVAHKAPVEISSGIPHFASSRLRRKGEVQMPRWSARMLLKNFFSRLSFERAVTGVGVACGSGVPAGLDRGVCAFVCKETMKRIRQNAQSDTARLPGQLIIMKTSRLGNSNGEGLIIYRVSALDNCRRQGVLEKWLA